MKHQAKRHLLVTLGIAVLIGFCQYFYYAFGNVERIIIKEKLADYWNTLSVICDEIDRHVTEEHIGMEDYRRILLRSTEKIDAIPGVYAEIFDSNMHTLSEQRIVVYKENLFTAEDHQIALDIMAANDSGTTTVDFGEQRSLPMHLAYRWVPTGAKREARLLVVIGVSRLCIDSHMSGSLIYGAAALISVTSILIIGNIIYMCQIGTIYSMRKGPEKWRGKTYSLP